MVTDRDHILCKISNDIVLERLLDMLREMRANRVAMLFVMFEKKIIFQSSKYTIRTMEVALDLYGNSIRNVYATNANIVIRRDDYIMAQMMFGDFFIKSNPLTLARYNLKARHRRLLA